MGSHKNHQPTLLRFYHKYLCEEDTAAFITEVAAHYQLSTLAVLARRGGRIERRAAIFALGLLGGYESNPILGEALRDSDRGVRLLADRGIRDLWMRQSGESARRRLCRIIRLNTCQRFSEADYASSELLRTFPDYAEARNQRSVARHNQSDWSGALADCHIALEINKYQFDAAAGAGFCHMALDAPEEALACFQHAVGIHPGLEIIRLRVKQLQQALEEL